MYDEYGQNIAATKRSVLAPFDWLYSCEKVKKMKYIVTVNEKKAPTDESVKLLMELEKKVQDKVEELSDY